MNSASAANTWKTSRPPGVVVSSVVQRPEPGIAAAQVRHGRDEVLQRLAEPVQPGDDQGVAGAQVVQASRQLGPGGVLARQFVSEYPQASRVGEGPDLGVEVLAPGGYPGIADQRAAGAGPGRQATGQ